MTQIRGAGLRRLAALFSFDGKAHGDVHGQKRFATARIERGHDDDIRSLVLAGHKFQVSTQYAERLIDDVTVALLDDNGLDFLRFLSEYPFLLSCKQRNLADERYGHTLQVFPSPYTGIHVLAHEDNDYRNEQSQSKRGHKDVLHTGDVGNMLPCGGVTMRVL